MYIKIVSNKHTCAFAGLMSLHKWNVLGRVVKHYSPNKDFKKLSLANAWEKYGLIIIILNNEQFFGLVSTKSRLLLSMSMI